MFTKDSRTETFLTQMGVEFRYSNNIAFESLMDGWKDRNIARPTPVREEAVIQYATLMESGSPAPAPILCQAGSRYDVLDGLQRLLASELTGATRISAYVVTTDSLDTLAAIRVLSNHRLQGRAETPEWNRRRATEVLVVQRGMSPKEVALMGGWRVADIEATANSLRWAKAVESIGGPMLPGSILESVARHTTIGELAKHAEPCAKFFSLVQAAKFSAEDAEPFIESFFQPIAKPANAHQKYVERLKEFEDEPELQIRIKGRKGGSISPDVKLSRALKTAITVLEEIVADGEKLLYVDEFFRLLKTIDKMVREVGQSRPQPNLANTPADMWSNK